VRIAHQLHTREAAAHKIAQKLGPERLGLGSPDRHAQHFAAAIGVHAHRDRHGDGDDPSPLTHLEIGRVDPEIGPFALDRTGEEGIDPLVDFLAEPADLALGDAGAAQSLHEVIHRPCRHAMDIGFLDDSRQRLLRKRFAVALRGQA